MVLRLPSLKMVMEVHHSPSCLTSFSLIDLYIYIYPGPPLDGDQFGGGETLPPVSRDGHGEQPRDYAVASLRAHWLPWCSAGSFWQAADPFTPPSPRVTHTSRVIWYLHSPYGPSSSRAAGWATRPLTRSRSTQTICWWMEVAIFLLANFWVPLFFVDYIHSYVMFICLIFASSTLEHSGVGSTGFNIVFSNITEGTWPHDKLANPSWLMGYGPTVSTGIDCVCHIVETKLGTSMCILFCIILRRGVLIGVTIELAVQVNDTYIFSAKSWSFEFSSLASGYKLTAGWLLGYLIFWVLSVGSKVYMQA